GAWVVSRYEDVRHVLTHHELFSSDAMRNAMLGIPPDFDPAKHPEIVERLMTLVSSGPFRLEDITGSGPIITIDPPEHTTQRDIVNRGFSPRRISIWEKRVREIVDELMSGMRDVRQFDLVQGLAIPLPMIVIAEMLGVEPERRYDFKRWSDSLVSGISGSGRGQSFAESGFAETMQQLSEYLQEVAEKRKAEPRDDLITALVRAEEGEGTLSAAQVVMFAIVLMVAGNETTTNLIGNTVNALLDHPDQLDLVVRDPSLIPALVDESLRYQSPIQFLFRRATQDTEIAGVEIAKGALVAPLLASANRDERQFENGDVFDITRNAQGHVAFGLGVHYCLGSHLARLEGRVAFEAIVPELSRLRRRDAKVEYVDSFLVRGPQRIELSWAA
ncbi:MAG: cytochrome P450, partial [Deltaproteobacteria bacterium]|nr:cytochrome P450 [Deltaproteobacteria bacterium]